MTTRIAIIKMKRIISSLLVQMNLVQVRRILNEGDTLLKKYGRSFDYNLGQIVV